MIARSYKFPDGIALNRFHAPGQSQPSGGRPQIANRESRIAFTLVELLVTIGIIGLLMAILLPALGAARQSARVTVCASSLRQICVAAMNYAHDNRGLLPPAHLDFLTANLHRWHGTRTSATDPFDFRTSPLYSYLRVPAIKQCPSFEPPPGGFEASAGGYGYNNYFLGSSTGDLGWTPRSVNLPARLSSVRRSSSKVAFADAAMAVRSGDGTRLIEYSFVEPPTSAYGPTSPSIHFRHRGRANVAWADGHVTSESMDWTYPTNVYGADNALAHLGFFGPRDNRLFRRD